MWACVSVCICVCVLLLLQLCYICLNRTLLVFFFFYPNNLQSRMHVQTHLLHALTQTHIGQVCRWSESMLRSTTGWHQHKKCVHRKMYMSSTFIYPSVATCLALILHLQKSRCLPMVGNLVPCKSCGLLIGMCQSIPKERCPNWS